MSKQRSLEEWKQLLTPERALKYSLNELAEMFEVNRSTIIRIKKELGLTNLRRNYLKYDWVKIFRQYNPLYYTSKEIAAEIGCHPTTVRKAISKYKQKKYHRRKLLKRFLTKERLKSYSLKDIAKDLNLTQNGVSKAISRLYRKNGKSYIKPRVKNIT